MNKRKKQKYGRRFSKKKIANLCDYLAKDILNNLRVFEKCAVSIPGPLCGEEGARNISESSAEWHEILQKMIWSFDQFSRGNPDEPFLNGYDSESAEQEAYDARMGEGFRLFGEWFGYLWL